MRRIKAIRRLGTCRGSESKRRHWSGNLDYIRPTDAFRDGAETPAAFFSCIRKDRMHSDLSKAAWSHLLMLEETGEVPNRRAEMDCQGEWYGLV
jgi:hypothetical protein